MQKKIKIPSQTTPHHKMQLRSWLAELAMIRTFGKLKPYFWRDSRWRGYYTREVRAVSKFIKSYGPKAIVVVACDPSIITFTNYAELEYFLQREHRKEVLRRQPKDFTETEYLKEETEDLREPRIKTKSKGLFERLDDINGH